MADDPDFYDFDEALDKAKRGLELAKAAEEWPKRIERMVGRIKEQLQIHRVGTVELQQGMQWVTGWKGPRGLFITKRGGLGLVNKDGDELILSGITSLPVVRETTTGTYPKTALVLGDNPKVLKLVLVSSSGTMSFHISVPLTRWMADLSVR